ncbi:alpha/beta hydrolase [Leptothoe sp. PORK10 BA2]|uniref:alpha/beta hydrolase n=1 Tax=Leptothoe sp. PORK10 BA2 TaxID=3110254 RepID=UPI002B1EABD2|nr:alpha/beta hydrolase [Leptothoe sp. PORK10 BA2]MEA5463583.1 alpha/beta hydrolase [Leptothoe sp. PORK10 BA2]
MLFYKGLLGLASAAGLLYGVLCGVLYGYQTKLIFKPTDLITETPADQQLAHEEVWIGLDGTAVPPHQGLHGWWLPGLPGKLSGLTLLYLHGNGENIGSNLGLAHRYQTMGFNVLLVDYRGYGLSVGPFPNEQRVYEDAIAAHRYLTEIRQISAQKLWLFGHSLGGAIAIELATQRPAAGLIVQSTFSSMLDAVRFSGQYEWMPVNWILTQRFDSAAKVPQLSLPVFYIHGLEDDTTAAMMSEQLHALSPPPKRLWLVPGAGHTNVATTAGPDYFTQVETFVQQMQSAVSIQPPRSPVE